MNTIILMNGYVYLINLFILYSCYMHALITSGYQIASPLKLWYRGVECAGIIRIFKLFVFLIDQVTIESTPVTGAVVVSIESAGSSGIGGTRPPPSSGLSNATPWVPMRTQLKSTANTGFFSVCASMLKHM